MNRYIKLFLSGFCLLATMNSCKDSFLDEEVLDSYAPEVLDDKLGFEAAVVGLHYQYGTFLTTTNDQTLQGIWHLGTDIVWAPAGRSNGDARHYFNYETLMPADNASRKVWQWLYSIINNANILISSTNVESVSGVTEEELAIYNGEGRFFRALAYNMLVTLYGDVPLVTEPLRSPKTDFVRTSVNEVDQVIIDDLMTAIDGLPTIGTASYDARGNKEMARHLLAEVYLRRGENALAEAQCDEIINSDLSLVKERYGVNANEPGDAFSDMFLFGNQRRREGNSEAIWVLEAENPTDVTGGSSGFPQQRRIWGSSYHDLPGMQPTDSLGGRGIARVRLNNWVVYELYEEEDMRNSKFNLKRQLYFNHPGENYDNIRGLPVPYGEDAEFTLADGETVIRIFAADTIFKYVPYTRKWGHYDERDNFGFGMWKDFMLMRLGETYLFRAEARFKQGNLSGAADDINELRERANASLVEPSDITLDFILDERVRELLAEENRRKTLVRTGTLVDRAKELTGTTPLADGAIETTNGLTETHTLMPIPLTEIELNKDAELEQNPGYN
ncbi:RagB/SusD family nutrient uptake outer membrane protein [Echinicola jeungdonensis]|uniref:RagB/SusD family nutrient uptake outer membrane protein n=1 Tax=Echinicola jeungdonensis TaxID=709343 RepID=A0ABV5J1F4_9BACT|nr:RagB/SusD family nutrient uptake outer membrane protein [Echinicola jeungdonensis]MDN3668489.1 RagB/SusD family nutrient uptake outer membrane protein [Echinicola jeungdonensis]